LSWAGNAPVVQEAASALEGRALDDDAADVEAAGVARAAGFEGAAPSAAAGLLGSVLDGMAVTSDPVLEAAAAGLRPERPARLSFL
jgi:hypothetical protein